MCETLLLLTAGTWGTTDAADIQPNPHPRNASETAMMPMKLDKNEKPGHIYYQIFTE